MYEIMEVYFPIEFNAPKANKDIFGITKQQLTDGLNACFVCDAKLSTFVLPMLFEKLDDDEVAANKEQMLDIISTLKHCCVSYGLGIVQSYLRDIYDKTKSMVLYGSEPDVTEAALDLIQSLVNLICAQSVDHIGYYDAESTINTESKQISNGCNSSTIPNGNGVIDSINTIGWTTFMEPFITDFKSEIKIPDAKLARLSSKIIIAISNSNVTAFEIVMKYLWTDIITKYQETKENTALISQQHALFEVISHIFMGLPSMNMNDASLHSVDIRPYCKVFMDEFEGENVADLNAKCLSMITLSYLCQSSVLLKESDIEHIVSVIYKEFDAEFVSQTDDDDDTKMDNMNTVQNATSIKTTSSASEQYREIMYNALGRIASTNPHIIVSQFVHPLNVQCGLSTFNNDQNKVSVDAALSALTLFLESVSALCLQNAFIWHHVIQIVLCPLLSISKRIQSEERQQNTLEMGITSCFHTMDIVLDFDKIETVKMDTVDKQENEQLIDDFLTGFIIEFPYQRSTRNHSNDLFLIIGRVISKLIACSSTELQNKFAKYSMENINTMMTLQDPQPDSYHLFIQLMAIASCNQLVNDANLLEFITKLQGYMLSDGMRHHENAPMMNHYFECIGCIVNKSDSIKIITPFINSDSFDTVIESIESIGNADNKGESTLPLCYLIWIIKALCVRCYRDKSNRKMKFLVEFLCKCLLSSNQEVGRMSADGFDIMMTDSALILSKKRGCSISNLYKQRLFNEAIRYIMDELWSTEKGDGSDSRRVYLLLAVGNLMRNVPHSVLTSHLSQLLPLMIQAFESSLDTLRISILQLMEVLLQSNLQCVVSYIKRIIPILVELTKYRKSEKVRISALNCLLLLSGLEYQVLHDITQNVIRSLQPVLSDRKKQVRQVAVQCRNKWFLLGE